MSQILMAESGQTFWRRQCAPMVCGREFVSLFSGRKVCIPGRRKPEQSPVGKRKLERLSHFSIAMKKIL